MHLNKNIKYLLTENRITQTELAKVLDVQPTTISSYLNGRNTPSFDNLIKIQQHFDVNLHDLVYNDLSQNQSNNTPNEPSFAKRLEELEAWKKEMDEVFDSLFSPNEFDKLLALFTEEFDMSLPELKEFFNKEVERRLKEEE